MIPVPRRYKATQQTITRFSHDLNLKLFHNLPRQAAAMPSRKNILN